MHRFPAIIGLAIRGMAVASFAAFLSPGVATAAPSAKAPTPDPSLAALSKACEGHDGWSDPAPPAHIFGNTWYVGTCGITVLLVTSPKGHVLIDGGPPEAAPLVARNIAALGFSPEDVRWIVASHEHFDHVGGLAQLGTLTGARVAVLTAQAAILRKGQNDATDPQFGAIHGFAPIAVDRTLADGGHLTLGPLVLTAHATPAHSPGSTSWTWTTCEGRTCRRIAYADSASTISADGYRFTAHPDRVAGVNAGIAALSSLPCNLLLTPHPGQSAMFERFAGKQPLFAVKPCRAYADAAKARFAARLERERAGIEP